MSLLKRALENNNLVKKYLNWILDLYELKEKDKNIWMIFWWKSNSITIGLNYHNGFLPYKQFNKSNCYLK